MPRMAVSMRAGHHNDLFLGRNVDDAIRKGPYRHSTNLSALTYYLILIRIGLNRCQSAFYCTKEFRTKARFLRLVPTHSLCNVRLSFRLNKKPATHLIRDQR